MKTFENIQKEIKNSFDSYFNSLLDVNGIPRKYFYWSEEFFRIEGFLKFEHFILSDNIKEELNDFGRLYFNSNDTYLSIEKNSNRNGLSITNYSKLFNESNKKEQSQRYEYVKEYVLYDLLVKLESVYQVELKDIYNKGLLNPEGRTNKRLLQLEVEIEILKSIIPIQKNNFLITYVQYITKSGRNIANKDYVVFSSLLQPQYEALVESIELIKRTKNQENTTLKNKIDCLYIHKDFKNKIHFVFSKEDGSEREELREMLEVMSKEKNGDYYRGQANASWILDASITREPKYKIYEPEMYYDILSLKPDGFKNDDSVYERLITMQHYSLPTRLLDITRNPLVSIFFACNNKERENNDGIVYSFEANDEMKFLNFEDERLKELESIYKRVKSDSEFLKGISFLKGVAKNQRINNQSGDFIFVGNGDGILEKLNNLPVMHIIIDSKTKKALLEQLESLNIHAGSVYPDLSSLSKYVSNKYMNLSDLKKEPEKIDVLVKEVEEKKEEEINLLPEDFWTDEKENAFNELTNDYNLKNDLTKELVDYYLENKSFLEHKILRVLHSKPSLLEMDKTRESLKSLLIDFMKQ